MLIATANAIWSVLPYGEKCATRILFGGCDASVTALRDKFGGVAVFSDGRLVSFRGAQPEVFATGVGEPITAVLPFAERPLDVLFGTEGAHLYRFREESGATRVQAFDALSCRDDWHTPWGGPPAVRSLAATPGSYVYADIHVGSIMRSPDGGESWAPVATTVHPDVHQVSTCPADPSRVYANTAQAVYVSFDCGQSWEYRGVDLSGRYGRAVVVDPEDPECLLATVSDGPHGDDVHGQLFRSWDCGKSWNQVITGFPGSTPDNINTHHLRFETAGLVLACVGRALYASRDSGNTWRVVWRAPSPIACIG